MLVIINAFKSIVRSKGRNILIGIIIIAIAASASIALAIKSAANDAQKASESLVNVTGSISVDRQKIMESLTGGQSTGERPDMSKMQELMKKYPNLTVEQLQKYADSEYVKDFYYSASSSLDASGDLEPYSLNGTDSDSSNENMPQMGDNQMSMGDFTLTGYNSESAMSDFVSGTNKITSGEMFDVGSNEKECLISSELATLNDLEVGDKITLQNPNKSSEKYTLTISGIYTSSNSSESEDQIMFNTAQDQANQIYLSYGALKSITDYSTDNATTESSDESSDENSTATSTALTSQLASTFVFETMDDYNNFKKELTEKDLGEYYTLSSSDVNDYENSLVPLQNLSNFASALLVIILGVGAVILVVINIFNIRERKYEVGVLTAIGIKKSKVALQFVTELFIVTFVSILIGTGIGAAASGSITNSLLKDQIQTTQVQSQNQNANFGRPNQTPENRSFGQDRGPDVTESTDYLDEVNATVNPIIVGQMVIIGLILTITSSIAGIVFVLRYEPLKILTNRS